jgi:phenylacetate-CoA ligase/benzoylacetate-CoA ligase
VLRYRSRDHIRVLGMGCACERTTPRIRCVGRTDDMLIYKAMNIFPSAIREIALGVGGDHLDGLTRVRKERAEQERAEQAEQVRWRCGGVLVGRLFRCWVLVVGGTPLGS